MYGFSHIFLVNSLAGLAGSTISLEVLPAGLPLWAVAALAGGVIGTQLGSRRLPVPALQYPLAAVLCHRWIEADLRVNPHPVNRKKRLTHRFLAPCRTRLHCVPTCVRMDGSKLLRFSPFGYPVGQFGPVRRIPLAEVVFEDQWGQVCRNS
jgi:hypothetical protein